MTIATSTRRPSGVRRRAGWAAVAVLALCAGAAQATTVSDPKGDILPTFDPKGAHTTDNFADLDVVSATAKFDSKNVFLTATMAGDIGSTDAGFYVWGVNTGTGTEFFQTLHNDDPTHQPDVGKGVLFDTFVIINHDLTGSVNYFSGEPAEGLGGGSITASGKTLSLVVPRALLDSTGFTIDQFTFNIWPRTNGFANGDIADFAPDDHNFTASFVPEPASWALMITGFGLAGAAMRRRRTPHAA